MKKTRKLIRIVLVAILVLIIGVVVLVRLFGNAALKTGIESAASKTLNVAVTLEDIDLSILGGSVSLRNLSIDNPPGYQHEKLLELGQGRVAVSIGSLLKDTVVIKEITLDNVTVVLEQRGVTSNNLQDVINAIPKEEEEAEEEKEEDATGKPAKKLHIDKLELTNIVVNVKLLPVPGKKDTLQLKLEPIVMTDLGSDNKMDVAALSAKILLAIAEGVAEQGAGILPEEMTNAMKATLNQALDMGKNAAEEGKKLLDEGAEAGKDILKGFKGLLKPKKDK